MNRNFDNTQQTRLTQYPKIAMASRMFGNIATESVLLSFHILL